MMPRLSIHGFLFILQAFSSLLVPGVASGLNDEIASVPFGPGEKMVFSIGYGVVDAGEAIVEIIGLTEYQGKNCYQIQSKANSNRFFSSIYRVRDKIVSYMDVETLYSRYFYKRLREGDYKKSVEISFDHEEALARYANGNDYCPVDLDHTDHRRTLKTGDRGLAHRICRAVSFALRTAARRHSCFAVGCTLRVAHSRTRRVWQGGGRGWCCNHSRRQY